MLRWMSNRPKIITTWSSVPILHFESIIFGELWNAFRVPCVSDTSASRAPHTDYRCLTALLVYQNRDGITHVGRVSQHSQSSKLIELRRMCFSRTSSHCIHPLEWPQQSPQWKTFTAKLWLDSGHSFCPRQMWFSLEVALYSEWSMSLLNSTDAKHGGIAKQAVDWVGWRLTTYMQSI